jgi:catechol 2,3-dioxygenase-like lactoylglutathione lyase family enzyme
MQTVLLDEQPQGKRESILKPMLLSHGTCECHNLQESRKFYEEFLGLQCVQIAPGGLAFSLGIRFHVVCLETGDQARPLSLMNHWGLECCSREEVQEAHRKAHKYKEQYKIGAITPIEFVGGRYSFYFEDLDQNWWEIQYYKGSMHDDFYDFGDQT